MLRDRAHMLAESRAFFKNRNVLEVDCPILGRGAAIDDNIDLMSVLFEGQTRLFLHSSPEYGMKRLLTQGSGDIYQLSHVFRDGERGERHRPEFAMVEWYRCGFTFQEMIDETVEFASLFSPRKTIYQLTYQAAFRRFANVDPYSATLDELRQAIEGRGLIPFQTEERDELLQLIMGCLIEPELVGDCWWVITHYPESQAALARRVIHEGARVAERFELYANGLELANGYHELSEPGEQEERFQQANYKRIAQGKEPLPIDQRLIQALQVGLPDCCGVAVGFDRLMMVRHNLKTIESILPEDML
jgi:elongation factor P--(R)-beta-lysine ligase